MFFCLQTKPPEAEATWSALCTGRQLCLSVRRVQQSDGSRGTKDSVSDLFLRDMNIYLDSKELKLSRSDRG